MLGSDRPHGQVYKSCVKPLVASLVDGSNATVFAYGQTGSGKTYTLGGGHVASLPEEESGIIGRVAADLFVLLGERRAADARAAVDVRVSYMELYQEELRDLLEVQTGNKELHVREMVHCGSCGKRNCEYLRWGVAERPGGWQCPEAHWPHSEERALQPLTCYRYPTADAG